MITLGEIRSFIRDFDKTKEKFAVAIREFSQLYSKKQSNWDPDYLKSIDQVVEALEAATKKGYLFQFSLKYQDAALLPTPSEREMEIDKLFNRYLEALTAYKELIEKMNSAVNRIVMVHTLPISDEGNK